MSPQPFPAPLPRVCDLGVLGTRGPLSAPEWPSRTLLPTNKALILCMSPSLRSQTRSHNPSWKEISTGLRQHRGCTFPLYMPRLLVHSLEYQGPIREPGHLMVPRTASRPKTWRLPLPQPQETHSLPIPQEDPGYKCPSLAPVSSFGSPDG